MKLTEQKLRTIIQEEIKSLNEANMFVLRFTVTLDNGKEEDLGLFKLTHKEYMKLADQFRHSKYVNISNYGISGKYGTDEDTDVESDFNGIIKLLKKTKVNKKAFK